MESIDCLVIGGGVLGLAIARGLASSGRQVMLAEQESAVAQHTSRYNSGVLHAGIYYAHGTMKAWACLQGQQALIDYAQKQHIRHLLCGKLIVAQTPEQHDTLLQLRANAIANGVVGLRLLRQIEVAQLEPAIQCYSALYSPQTAIIDVPAFVQCLLADITTRDVQVATSTIIERVDLRSRPYHVICRHANENISLKANNIVNSAGLWAHVLSHQFIGLDPATIPTVQYAKGCYFNYSLPAPFKHLIYPLPNTNSLGIHATCGFDGRCRFGPNYLATPGVDYTFDAGLKETFYQAIRHYFPPVKRAHLSADTLGIRAQVLDANGQSDFVVQGRRQHGIDGLVNLYGIDSPGLTACFALGARVCDEVCLA